jgi:hypothetical protein
MRAVCGMAGRESNSRGDLLKNALAVESSGVKLTLSETRVITM